MELIFNTMSISPTFRFVSDKWQHECKAGEIMMRQTNGVFYRLNLKNIHIHDRWKKYCAIKINFQLLGRKGYERESAMKRQA